MDDGVHGPSTEVLLSQPPTTAGRSQQIAQSLVGQAVLPACKPAPMVHSIPVGRPQPKLSKLMAQQEQKTQASAASATFVFWDLQNTPLPAELCTLPSAALQALTKRLAAASVTVVTEVPASTKLGAGLLQALKATSGVQLLTFLKATQPAAGGTAADYELKRVSSWMQSSPCNRLNAHACWRQRRTIVTSVKMILPTLTVFAM